MVAITTYSKLQENANYKELYLEFPWLFVCLDEAHTSCNSETQACQLLQKIHREICFCLTDKFVCLFTLLQAHVYTCIFIQTRTKKKIFSIYCCGYHRVDGYQVMSK